MNHHNNPDYRTDTLSHSDQPHPPTLTQTMRDSKPEYTQKYNQNLTLRGAYRGKDLPEFNLNYEADFSPKNGAKSGGRGENGGFVESKVFRGTIDLGVGGFLGGKGMFTRTEGFGDSRESYKKWLKSHNRFRAKNKVVCSQPKKRDLGVMDLDKGQWAESLRGKASWGDLDAPKWRPGTVLVEKWEPLMHTCDARDESPTRGFGSRIRTLDRETLDLTREKISRRSQTNSGSRILKKPKSKIDLKPGDLGWNKKSIKGSGYGYLDPNSICHHESHDQTPRDTIRTDCVYYNPHLKLYCRAIYTPQGHLHMRTPKTKIDRYNLPDETWSTIFKCTDPTNLN